MQCVTKLAVRKLLSVFFFCQLACCVSMHELELQAELWQLCASTLLLASLPRLPAWQVFLQQNA